MPTKVQKVSSLSEDVLSKKKSELKQIFPEAFAEDRLDWDKLKITLGEEIDSSPEKYDLSWAGKSDAFKAIRIPSTGTLNPQEKESKDWNSTENIFIEGDNLEVLKLLQKHYREKVKMIYIDPPYNTGKDFIYKDNFTEDASDYYERSGQSKDGIKLTSNMESNGRYHSDWLTMMYPRLFLARNLIRDDGVIFVSIDDNEVTNLRLIMDEIFGEENFVACVVWKRKRGRDNSARWFSKSHEFLLVYAKNILSFNTNYLELDEETKDAYKNPDNDPRGIYRMLAVWARGTQGGVEYDFTNKNGQYFTKREWLFSKSNLTKLDLEDKLLVRGDNLYRKLFINENKGKIPETIWDNTSNAANASDEIKSMFGDIIFDTAKPIPYIKEMLKIATVDSDIILDFFAGSSTTAHAIMDLNAEDNGNRKWICVQIPEKIDEKSEAKKAGFNTITEISRERIRLAGKKIDKGDIGFKAFKLSKSNYRQWNVITDKDDTQKLKEQMNLFLEKPLVDGYDEKFVVYELLEKEGFDLNAQVVNISIPEKTGIKVWQVTKGEIKMIVSFAKKLTQEQVGLLGLKENDVFVCLDLALDDTTKVNLMRNFNLKVI